MATIIISTFDPLGLDYFVAKAQGHAKRLIGCVLAHPRLKAFEGLTEQCAFADRLLLMLSDAEHVDLNLYGTTPSVARHSACILSNLSVCYMHARCSCN
jgi:hypothetical protein